MKKRKTGVIYYWRHMPTGKRYVGQSINYGRRLLQYQNDVDAYKRTGFSNTRIIPALAADFDNFEIHVIHHSLTQDEMDSLEEHYIALWETMNVKKGYNLSPGGQLKYISRADIDAVNDEMPDYICEMCEQYRCLENGLCEDCYQDWLEFIQNF